MPRSKDIQDYFKAQLEILVPGRETTFDLHLYFERSNHILLWRTAGDDLSEDLIAKYRAKGLNLVWIHRDDRGAFDRYLNPKVRPPVAKPEPAPPAPEALAIVEALTSPAVPDEKKAEVVAVQAQQTLRATAAPTTLPDQREANRLARKIVEEVLAGVQGEAQSIVNEIWKLSNIDPCFVHAVNVATYSVLFALAFGRIDISLMTDLALAALLHDIGLSQIDADIASTPMRAMGAEQNADYARHVMAGLELIHVYGMGISARVKLMIEQHHEKFDGSGYPKRLQGFHLDDVAQLLAMAELLESVCAGAWDGTDRTLGDALDTLEQLEKARTFPEHFNPDVFSAVMRWTRSPTSADATRAALDVVKNQTQNLVQASR